MTQQRLELPPELQTQVSQAQQQQMMGQMAAQWRQAVGIEHGQIYDVVTTHKVWHRVLLEEIVLSIGPTGIVPQAVKIRWTQHPPEAVRRGAAQTTKRITIPWHAMVEFVRME